MRGPAPLLFAALLLAGACTPAPQDEPAAVPVVEASGVAPGSAPARPETVPETREPQEDAPAGGAPDAPVPASPAPATGGLPRAGTYRYDVVLTVQSSDPRFGMAERRGSETLVVEPASRRAGAWEQRWRTDRFFWGDTEQRVSAERGEVRLLIHATHSQDSQGYPVTTTCRYVPAALLVRLPAAAGDEWETTSRCDGDDRTVELAVEVVDEQPWRIGGAAVPAFHLRLAEHTKFPGPTTGPGGQPNDGAWRLTEEWRRASDGLLLEYEESRGRATTRARLAHRP